MLLKKAVEWGVIERMPCVIRLLSVPKAAMSFHDFADFEKLLDAAAKLDWRAELIVLLGGEAGLRREEITALEWDDVDHVRGRLCVQRSEWKGQITMPKGGRLRYVPLTERLSAGLRKHRHLRGPRVLCNDDGSPLTTKIVADHVRRAARRANLKREGVHILRHTFCSHLAMKGASAKAIQELAGHQDLRTTQMYMHLSASALEGAIRLLDNRAVPTVRGNIGERDDFTQEANL